MSALVTTAPITVAPAELAAALKVVKSIKVNSVVEALNGVQINCGNGHGEIARTNMTTSVRRGLACEGEDFTALVSLALLDKAAAALAKAPEITLTREPAERGEVVAVRGGARVIRLPILREEDFPVLGPRPGGGDAPTGPKPYSGEILFGGDAGEFAKAVKRALPFTTGDGTRPVLTGIYFYERDGQLEVHATDSYRLCLLRPEGLDAVTGTAVNVTADGLKLATRNMKVGQHVAVSRVGAVVHINNYAANERWTVRVIDGQYPNFHQLIPDDTAFYTEVRMPKAELQSACELAVQFAQRNAPMRLNVNGSVIVTGHTPDTCSFEEKIAGASVHALNRSELQEFEIGFNPSFMLDTAKTIAGAEAVVKFISPTRPALVVDGDDLFLHMPIRLNV